MLRGIKYQGQLETGVMDVLMLSRLQWALTICFHYIFPPLTIGMGVVLVYLEGMYLKTKDPLYESATKFWTRIYAVNFAMGVATGIVMEFQFGTNWAMYSRFVGDVFGSALAAEGIFAFFLESGFLAVLVFGWDRVSPKMHFFSTIMVSLGSIFSSIWIVVANSWQQTPAGSHVVQMTRDGRPWFLHGVPVDRAQIVNFWHVVFNPSSVERLVHVWLAAFIYGSFFIMSVSAWYILKKRHTEFAKRSFTGALILATVSSLAILVSGDSQAKEDYHQQPSKLAAFEGHYKTGPAGLSIFGIPNDKEQKLDYNVSLPGMLSWLIGYDTSYKVVGLDAFPKRYQPPVMIPFVTYHLMVGLGMLFIGLTLLACFLRWRGTLFNHRWLMWIFVVAVLGAFAANELGWTAAEVGRQPWVVYPPPVKNASGDFTFDKAGYLKLNVKEGMLTKNGISSEVTSGEVLGSIIMFSVIYLLLGAVWLVVLNSKIQAGPAPVEPQPQRTPPGGVVEAATQMTGRSESLTEAKGPPGEKKE